MGGRLIHRIDLYTGKYGIFKIKNITSPPIHKNYEHYRLLHAVQICTNQLLFQMMVQRNMIADSIFCINNRAFVCFFQERLPVMMQLQLCCSRKYPYPHHAWREFCIRPPTILEFLFLDNKNTSPAPVTLLWNLS